MSALVATASAKLVSASGGHATFLVECRIDDQVFFVWNVQVPWAPGLEAIDVEGRALGIASNRLTLMADACWAEARHRMREGER